MRLEQSPTTRGSLASTSSIFVTRERLVLLPHSAHSFIWLGLGLGLGTV